MQQIKLDDKHDLAIDGNEAWIIDYSAGLFSPRAGEKHTFHLSLEPTEVRVDVGEDYFVITYVCNGNKIMKVARIDGDSIAFCDSDDLLRIEQEYQDNLTDIRMHFAEFTKECEGTENRDAMRFLEGRNAFERYTENLALAKYRAIEALKQTSPDPPAP